MEKEKIYAEMGRYYEELVATNVRQRQINEQIMVLRNKLEKLNVNESHDAGGIRDDKG